MSLVKCAPWLPPFTDILTMNWHHSGGELQQRVMALHVTSNTQTARHRPRPYALQGSTTEGTRIMSTEYYCLLMLTVSKQSENIHCDHLQINTGASQPVSRRAEMGMSWLGEAESWHAALTTTPPAPPNSDSLAWLDYVPFHLQYYYCTVYWCLPVLL